jgi:hypothetical protein
VSALTCESLSPFEMFHLSIVFQQNCVLSSKCTAMTCLKHNMRCVNISWPLATASLGTIWWLCTPSMVADLLTIGGRGGVRGGGEEMPSTLCITAYCCEACHTTPWQSSLCSCALGKYYCAASDGIVARLMYSGSSVCQVIASGHF